MSFITALKGNSGEQQSQLDLTSGDHDFFVQHFMVVHSILISIEFGSYSHRFCLHCLSQLMFDLFETLTSTTHGYRYSSVFRVEQKPPINLSLSKQVLCVPKGPAGHHNTPTIHTHTQIPVLL